MSKNILVVLPYSGRAFGGGVAVFNEELCKALGDDNDVKLLTFDLWNSTDQKSINPSSGSHKAEIIYINDVTRRELANPRGDDAERAKLYDEINDPSILFARDWAKDLGPAWKPDIIIGHSRFSGPAAIRIKQTLFPSAYVQYFLHSYPVEGTVLVGHKAYGEDIDQRTAAKKLEDERRWMAQADMIVPVGGLLRAGAKLLVGTHPVRIHECIGGAEIHAIDERKAPADGHFHLLFNGRANAPIKGLDDILVAAGRLNVMADEYAEKDKEKVTPFPTIDIHVRYWQEKTITLGDAKKPGNDPTTVDVNTVQEYVDGALRKLDGDKRPIPRKVSLKIHGISDDIMRDMLASHAVLMPSYIEHFGLVPGEALALGVPVLMNEVSGAAFFFSDPKRFGDAGKAFVVPDFCERISPSRPERFLDPGVVPVDAYENRDEAWANAMLDLVEHLGERIEQAAEIGRILQKDYTWKHCAKALVAAAAITYDSYPITQQGPGGSLWNEQSEPLTTT